MAERQINDNKRPAEVFLQFSPTPPSKDIPSQINGKNGQQKRWAHKKGNGRKAQQRPKQLTVGRKIITCGH